MGKWSPFTSPKPVVRRHSQEGTALGIRMWLPFLGTIEKNKNMNRGKI